MNPKIAAPQVALAATGTDTATREVRHLTQTELSHRLGVSEPTLERWRSSGIGPIFLKLAGRVRYRLADVIAYEEACLRSSTSCSVQRASNATATGERS